MLRNQCGCCQLAELQLRLDTKQSRTTPNERRTSGHAHITRLKVLDDLIFLSLVSEFQVLVVKLKCRIGVVSHVELHLVAHRSGYRSLNLLVKVKVGLSTGRHHECRVVGLVALDAHVDGHRALCLELHTSRTEHRLKRAQPKLHIKEVKRLILLLLSCFRILLTVILLHRLPQGNILILLRSEQEWSHDIVVTNLGVYHIMTCFIVIFGCRSDVAGVLQVGGTLHKLQVFVTLRQLVVHIKTQVHRILGPAVCHAVGARGRWRRFWIFGFSVLSSRYRTTQQSCTQCEQHSI